MWGLARNYKINSEQNTKKLGLGTSQNNSSRGNPIGGSH